MHKCNLGAIITFNAVFDFPHILIEVVQASTNIQHNAQQLYLLMPPSTQPTKQSHCLHDY